MVTTERPRPKPLSIDTFDPQVSREPGELTEYQTIILRKNPEFRDPITAIQELAQRRQKQNRPLSEQEEKRIFAQYAQRQLPDKADEIARFCSIPRQLLHPFAAGVHRQDIREYTDIMEEIREKREQMAKAEATKEAKQNIVDMLPIRINTLKPQEDAAKAQLLTILEASKPQKYKEYIVYRLDQEKKRNKAK
jgi:hypothetical protein